jgi:membrane associated rhomboid family serine protease
MGATFLIARARGLTDIAGQIGFYIIFNLAFTFGASNISVGGHLGGLVGGALCALVIFAGERGKLGQRAFAIEIVAMTLIALAAFAAAIVIA